ncbi:AGROH133_08824 family phage infection protein [Rhizobium sp. A37_96]
MELYFPTEFGEQLAYCSAVVTAIIGLFLMFAPGYAYRFLKLQVKEGRSEAYAEARSAGGFMVGFGLVAILLAQPMIYLALGASFGVAAFGRILSLMSDRGSILLSLLLLVVQAILAALPFLYGLGYI